VYLNLKGSLYALALKKYLNPPVRRNCCVTPTSHHFVSLPSACTHSWLVEEGRHYFFQRTEVHGVELRTHNRAL
ncbi:hypothetical protein TIFTF001_055535, partial [Ficus carica]